MRSNHREAQTSNAALSRELGINVKTVAKWRKRDRVEDTKTGPKAARSTVLSTEEEAIIVAFRRPLSGRRCLHRREEHIIAAG